MPHGGLPICCGFRCQCTIVEAMPKDPYYNYGRQIFSIEQNSFAPVWKQIYNRSGEYWRTGVLWAEFPRFKQEGKDIVCFDGVGHDH